MKKYLLSFLIGLTLIATPVLAVSNFDRFLEWLGTEEETNEDEMMLGRATATYNRSLLPEVTDIYDLGTTTLQWNGAFNNIVIDGTCTGPGCDSFAYPWTPTQHFGEIYSATSSPLWIQSDLAVSGTARMSDVFIGDGFDLTVGNDSQITLQNAHAFQVLGTAAQDAGMIVGRFSANEFGPRIDLVKSRGATIGSTGIVQDSDEIGHLRYYPDDGNDLATVSAVFSAEVDDASPTTDDVGTAFVWESLAGGGDTTLNEVMRLSASGDLSIATKNVNNYIDFYNGTFVETFNALVQSDGVSVSSTIQSSTGGDLTMRFSDGDTVLDCTPECAFELVAGSDASPQANWLYIPQSTKQLTTSTSGWPSATTEFIKVSYFLCPSVATVQTNDGCYINQNWNDGNGNGGTSDKGHLVDITSRVRLEGSKYFSGIDGNGDASTYLVITAGNVELKSTAGIVSQMHLHSFPAFDTSLGDEVLVKNWNGDAYHNITNLNDISADSQGVSTVNKWMNLVVWGVANKGADNYEPVIINLPACSYTTQASAEQDISGCDDFTLPRDFNLDSGTGFLISRITVRDQATWTYGSAVDLRGSTPSVATGGASGVAQSFPDNTFNVFDNTDNTKVLAFDVGASVTTGNTRTLTVPDASGEMCLVDATQTLSNKTFSSDILLNANNSISLGAFGGAFQNIFTSSTAHLDFVSSTAMDLGLLTMGGNIEMGGNSIINASSVLINTSTLYTGMELQVNGSAMTEELATSTLASMLIDWSEGNQQTVTLNQAGHTINFSNQREGQPFRLFLYQDGTGSRTVTTWDSDILWSAETAPTLNTAVGRLDIITCVHSGATTTAKTFCSSIAF